MPKRTRVGQRFFESSSTQITFASLILAFAIVMSFRIVAVRATMGFLPLSMRR